MENLGFNETYTKRTKELSVQTIYWFKKHAKGDEVIRIIGKQLLRSVTSMAANFRAACRARSAKEYYAKLCIVVEECDETLFWLEIFNELDWINKNGLQSLMDECLVILKVMAKSRKNVGDRLKQIK